MRSSLKAVIARALVLCVVAAVGLAVDGVGHANIAAAADVDTFHGQSPARLLDTRPGSPTVDGQFAGIGAIASNRTVNVTILGRGGIPASGVGAVALNVTATNPMAPGFVTVYPTGVVLPTASNLNFAAGQTIANMVLVPIGAGGQITVFSGTGGTVDVVADVLGWFPTGVSFAGLKPARVQDTRLGFATIDGQFAALGGYVPGGVTNLTVVGRGEVPASGVGAVALNMTVTNPVAAGYLTVYPAGAARPTASNVNFVIGQTIPNMVIVPVGADGKVSIFNGSGGTIDVITDVLGWFPVGAGFSGLTPARLLDTRPGLDTIDGLFEGGGTVGEASTRNLLVTGRGGVPAANVGAVALNVTVTDPTKPGYFTIYPQGALRPTASNLNFVAGQTIANMVIVPVGSSGQISIFNASGDSHVIVDVLGWFPNPTDPPTVYGNNLKLKSNGIGTALFASTPNTAISLLTTHFGGPVSDAVETFPQAIGGGLFVNPDTARLFSYRLARIVCFIDYLCLVFGGNNSSSLTFVGYVYDGAALTDVNGLGNGARGSDFPGAIVTIDDGPRCFAIGTGRSKSGINLTLRSHGPYYYDPNTGVRATPSLNEVEVTSMYAGAFPDFAFECYPDDY